MMNGAGRDRRSVGSEIGRREGKRGEWLLSLRCVDEMGKEVLQSVDTLAEVDESSFTDGHDFSDPVSAVRVLALGNLFDVAENLRIALALGGDVGPGILRGQRQTLYLGADLPFETVKA